MGALLEGILKDLGVENEAKGTVKGIQMEVFKRPLVWRLDFSSN